MKPYRYLATFRAYDRMNKESFEFDEPVNIGIVENKILNICQTAIIHSIVVSKQELIAIYEYQNNKHKC
jgi:hypothetical protein